MYCSVRGANSFATFQRLRKDYEKDEDIRKVLEGIGAHLELKTLKNRIYLIIDGRIRLYIPKEELRSSVMRYLHDARYACHLAIKITIDLVSKDF